MTTRIRFHLDEHINPRVAEALRRHGIDVTTTLDAGLRSSTDEAQWQFVCQEQRVFVTQDDDFLRIASRDQSHAGIAFIPGGVLPTGSVVRTLILFYEVLTAEDMAGRVEYL